ncbi:MAG: hypothetical protein LBG57_14365 [Treponema sp.]|jgi:hypothetical protein|nr:hypothetical protein [Treponema sp.]
MREAQQTAGLFARGRIRFMKNGSLLFLVLAAAAAPLFPVSLAELVGAEKAAALNAGGVIVEVQLKNPVPRILPQHEALRRLIAETMDSLAPGLFVETLYRYQKPRKGVWSEAERTALFNQTLALSTLTGIQYYSASRGVMRTFYESSRVIDGPDSKKALPDPVYSALPPSLTLYARQKDLTFGDNIYRYNYLSVPDAFFFVQENLTALTAGIIPAVGKNKLRTVMAVIDCGDSALIYFVSMAKAVSLPGMGERIGNSFTNRAEAVLKWFTGRADKVLEN